MSVNIHHFTRDFARYFPGMEMPPWTFLQSVQEHIVESIARLDDGFTIRDNVAVHRSAIIEEGVILKGPLIISANTFVGAHAYLRGGVFLGEYVQIGPGCEVKSSLVLDRSALAHFNFAGDSIIGADVNMEAGSVLANFHNDRDDKNIDVYVGGEIIRTGVIKFGSVVGDGCRIGANSVCSPGTILEPGTRIGRLVLVNQVPEANNDSV